MTVGQKDRQLIEILKVSLFEPSEASILEVPVDAVDPCGTGVLNVVHHFRDIPNILFLVNDTAENDVSIRKEVKQRSLAGLFSLPDGCY